MTTRQYKHPQINLRIPKELKKAIEEATKATHRSMNAEIIARLESTFNTENHQNNNELLELMREVIKEELSKNK